MRSAGCVLTRELGAGENRRIEEVKPKGGLMGKGCLIWITCFPGKGNDAIQRLASKRPEPASQHSLIFSWGLSRHIILPLMSSRLFYYGICLWIYFQMDLLLLFCIMIIAKMYQLGMVGNPRFVKKGHLK